MSDHVEECQGSTPPPCEEGAPLWTTTFGDMMSLLLTFFILMFSMSELKMERFLLASQSMREAVGGTATESVEDPMGLMPDPVDPDLQLQAPGQAEESTSAPVSGDGESAEIETLVEAYMDMIVTRLEEFTVARGLEETVSIQKDGQGVYLRMQTGALFTSGSATVADSGRAALWELADVTSSIDVRVVVSGHADDRPISGGVFASNWELSAARAAGVARALVERGQDPEMVRVESYGEYRPIASNDTPEGRAQNRRVELFYSKADIVATVKSWAVLAEVRVDVPRPTSPATDPGNRPQG